MSRLRIRTSNSARLTSEVSIATVFALGHGIVVLFGDLREHIYGNV